VARTPRLIAPRTSHPALRTPHFEPRTPDIARGYHQRMLQAQVTAFFLFDVADSINLTMLAGIE
jgi:hypothetical protein